MAAALRESEWQKGEITLLEIHRLYPHPLNPRGEVAEDDCLELAASIRSKGILQPLLVTPNGEGFYLIAGHRRRTAAKLAGLQQVPCIIRSMSDDEALDLMMIENLQREDLTAMQEARAFQHMKQAGRSVIEIVERLGLSDGYVAARLAILGLEPGVQHLFELNLLPVGAAAILALAGRERQKYFATLAVQQQIPLRKLEQMIAEAVPKAKKRGRPKGETMRKKVLGEYEVFTRSEALRELERDGSVPFSLVRDAFNDICDGICTEDDSREMCEACPAPRLVASLLRRSGVNLRGERE